jgi:hypothetical protein
MAAPSFCRCQRQQDPQSDAAGLVLRSCCFRGSLRLQFAAKCSAQSNPFLAYSAFLVHHPLWNRGVAIGTARFAVAWSIERSTFRSVVERTRRHHHQELQANHGVRWVERTIHPYSRGAIRVIGFRRLLRQRVSDPLRARKSNGEPGCLSQYNRRDLDYAQDCPANGSALLMGHPISCCRTKA